MNIENKVFYKIIAAGTLLCILLGIAIRFSITEFKLENINNICGVYPYYPYDSVEYSNGTYPDIGEIKDTDSIYKYIVKGRCTGNRKALHDSVLTEIQVDDVLKGNVSNKKIKIYEPIGLQGNMISTFEGYNFIKDNKEYIFCLTDLKKGVKNHDENNIKIYNYSTLFYGKFPVEYKESDFKIYIDNGGKENKKFNEFKDSEQVFSSEDRKKLYLQERSRLMKLLN